jgi:hypothetical protein
LFKEAIDQYIQDTRQVFQVCILLYNTFLSATVFSFYIFTFLMFRKLNKPQLTKIKQPNFIGIRVFDSRLYLDISKAKRLPKYKSKKNPEYVEN